VGEVKDVKKGGFDEEEGEGGKKDLDALPADSPRGSIPSCCCA
jgi:hypothetical protein